MIKKIVKSFTVSSIPYSYTNIEDYTELVNEWIENGANGTEEDILYYMRDGTFTSEDKDTCAFGWLEALVQSDHCPPFICQSNNCLTIKVETVEFKE